MRGWGSSATAIASNRTGLSQSSRISSCSVKMPNTRCAGSPNFAATHRGEHKWAEAIAVYEELVHDDVANAGRWRWEVASTHRDAGQLPEAIGHFRQCENFPENYKQMAWCHRQLKQPKEAITLYGTNLRRQGFSPLGTSTDCLHP